MCRNCTEGVILAGALEASKPVKAMPNTTISTKFDRLDDERKFGGRVTFSFDLGSTWLPKLTKLCNHHISAYHVVYHVINVRVIRTDHQLLD